MNPLLTISALAERGAALIAADRGWAVDDTPAEPLAEDGPAHREGPIAFQTSEHMEGFIGPAEAADFEEGLRLGEQAGTELSFLITLRSADLDAMLDDDPDHGATIVGTVTCPSLSAQPLTITGGTFTWFGRNRLDPGSRRDKEMRYAMTLHSEEGRTYRLEGLKVIHDDPGFDLWSDTTRLFVTVKEGESPDRPVVGRGILHMTPDSLVRSLTTFRVSGSARSGHQARRADPVRVVLLRQPVHALRRPGPEGRAERRAVGRGGPGPPFAPGPGPVRAPRHHQGRRHSSGSPGTREEARDR